MNENVKKSQILIVDDTPKNIELLGKVLSDQGYKIIIAENGIQALKVVDKILPDLILLDIMMPEMDGYETCKHLKEKPETSEIPIIFLTARVEIKDIVKGFQMGAVDYVTKPFNIAELRQRVKTHLALKFAKEELKEQVKLREDIDRITQHDLKNPLNAIINLPDFIKMKGKLSDEQKKDLERIKISALQMLGMINRSLDLVKMERGTYELSPDSFDIIKVINKVIEDMAQSINFKKLIIKITLNENNINTKNSFFVLGEELLSYSMLSNLLKNAIEASPPDSTIAILLSSIENNAIIKIYNSGFVPLEIRDRFFEKYVTYGKGKDGNGLGTYSAKLMAEIQNGNISMNSSKEDGTTITISLPIR